MRRFSTIGFASLLSLVAFLVQAQELPSELSNATHAYRKLMNIGTIHILVPTVVSVPVQDTNIERRNFAVLDKTAGKFEPYVLENMQKSTVSVRAEGMGQNLNRMTDNDSTTFTEFDLPEDVKGEARIILTGAKTITSTSLSVLLDNFVALPKTIEIRVLNNDQEKIVLAKTAMGGQTVNFPKTTAQTWIVTVTFGQPLRIAELHLSQDNEAIRYVPIVRFLAQPSHDYLIYFDSDRFTTIQVGEAGNLLSNDNVRTLSAFPSEKNSEYIIADVDGDGVADLFDNCVNTVNTDQKDVDSNGRGDVCDDFDKDGLITIKDNCPNDPNTSQIDKDGDGIGDACDKEESRITEKNAWLPWAGMGFAAGILVLLSLTMLKPKQK